jgi:hypothetical protein
VDPCSECTFLCSLQPLHTTLPYPFTSHPSFFNSYQYISLYPLPSHGMFYDITDSLSFPLPFPPSPSSIEKFHCYKHVYIWVCVWSCLFGGLCLSFGSILHMWVKTCGICLSDPGLRHQHDVLQLYLFTFKPHVTYVIIPYSWAKLLYMYTYIYVHTHTFLIHSSVTGHLGCFQRLAIVNSAAINISAQVSRLYPVLHSFG